MCALKHDGAWSIVGLLVIATGLFGVMAISGSDPSHGPQEVGFYRGNQGNDFTPFYDVDSMAIFLLSAFSDTSWAIKIPMKGIPPLDTLKVVWYKDGIQYAGIYSGWTDVDRTIDKTQ